MAQQKMNAHANFMLALGEADFHLTQCVVEIMKNPDDVMGNLSLGEGAKVQLDEHVLSYDKDYPSYNAEISRDEFLGKHVWKVLLPSGKTLEYSFEVLPFTFKDSIPAVLKPKDLKIECENLKSSDEVILFLSGDFSSNTETYLSIKPQNGYFVIPERFIRQIEPDEDQDGFQIHFNIERVEHLKDEYFKKGVRIEWTKVTVDYFTRLE